VPASFSWLQRQLVLNGVEERVTLHRAVVGAQAGSLLFSVDQGTMNRVVVADYPGVSQLLPVIRLDSIPSVRDSCCWKLDVEGHELAVLAGAQCTLAEAPPAAILAEDRSPPVVERLLEAGFQACAYDPWSRCLSPDTAAPGGNQLWVRDLDWVRERLRSAPVFEVLGLKI
jgi:FkbM family methyltransferase